jgi:hypothetical protein
MPIPKPTVIPETKRHAKQDTSSTSCIFGTKEK